MRHITNVVRTAAAAALVVGAPLAARAQQGQERGEGLGGVTDEVHLGRGAQAALRAVEVDLHAGGVSTVTVSSTAPVDAERVREAVEEAGYSLAAAS